mmetsp:Transcript_11817/g.30840  ORF Transcript_11817/g.30840 Transcript_11817/m.30840 type:complete len:130 (-) Transcript_11817:449-838(-)|eukprot:CAMPEP_0119430634 /NCGR_PEP_ID=MMETSP1335-20130426/44480_1 /TAXON_ID=259385 /ORGANISM="Chrysoculter rhomboideus, Strain RCC1486" /LENGTH=129 /DNA_ID=CAMNT_0007456395 /DNA_START=151 /DNA_END=540 /DNA_ORIENTATION=+
MLPAAAGDGRACTADSECREPDADAMCVRGSCAAPPVYTHDAFSLGIARRDPATDAPDDALPGGWTVTDASLPNWAEPYWGALSTVVWEYGAVPAEGGALLAAGVIGAAGAWGAVKAARAVVAGRLAAG